MNGRMAEHEAGHPAPARGDASTGALWFGIFAGPAAWSIQTLVNYAMAAHGCYPALYPRDTPSFGGMWITALLVSIAAVGVSVAAGAFSYREWTRTRGELGSADTRPRVGPSEAPPDVGSALEVGEGRTRFMAMSGILTSLVFVVASALHGLTLFLVSPCGV